MREIEARHRRAGPHGEALGQLDAGRLLRVEQAEDRALLGVVGLGRIAGRRADAAILLRDQLLARELLVRRIAPELAPHALVHALGEGFRQAVGQRLEHDAAVVVGLVDVARQRLGLADAGRDGEGADVVGEPGLLRRDEIGERRVGAVALARRAPICWRSVYSMASRCLARLVGVELDVVADGVGRPEADHGAGGRATSRRPGASAWPARRRTASWPRGPPRCPRGCADICPAAPRSGRRASSRCRAPARRACSS